MKPRRILLVAVNWLGDILFMTPAIRAIRKAHPDAHIACWVAPRGVELLQGNPHLNAVIPFEEPRGIQNLRRWGSFLSRLKVERFDAVYLFHRSFSRAFISWLAGIPHRIGYRTWKRGWLLTQAIPAPQKDSVHKAAWFLRMVEQAGVPSDGFTYDLSLSQEDHERAADLLSEWKIGNGHHLVALHPGANWRLKRWPAHSFADLADRLSEKFQARVVFLGSQEDLPLVNSIVGRMRCQPLLATGRLTLRELGALLTRMSLLISNDSGPLHLAIAVGTPVIGLFGPTTPSLTGPPEGAKAISLFGSIGCPVPCYQLNCPVNLCMQEITVDKVLESAARFL